MESHNNAAQVPEELMNRLHEANQHLHDARLGVERAMEGSDYRHQERVDTAEDQLRRVQNELDEIDRAIHAALHPNPSADGS